MSLLNLNSKKLRIALKAYEPKLLDDSCRQIIESVNLDGSEVTGPVPFRAPLPLQTSQVSK